MYMRGSIYKQDAPACLTGMFLTYLLTCLVGMPLVDSSIATKAPNHFCNCQVFFVHLCVVSWVPHMAACLFCGRSQVLISWVYNLLCRLLLQQRIVEHFQSEASAQRTRPWQYTRRSAVIDRIFAAMTIQEHGFTWVTYSLWHISLRSLIVCSCSPLSPFHTHVIAVHCSQSARCSCKAHALAQGCWREHVFNKKFLHFYRK